MKKLLGIIALRLLLTKCSKETIFKMFINKYYKLAKFNLFPICRSLTGKELKKH